jgi:hypothetical protein
MTEEEKQIKYIRSQFFSTNEEITDAKLAFATRNTLLGYCLAMEKRLATFYSLIDQQREINAATTGEAERSDLSED